MSNTPAEPVIPYPVTVARLKNDHERHHAYAMSMFEATTNINHELQRQGYGRLYRDGTSVDLAKILDPLTEEEQTQLRIHLSNTYKAAGWSVDFSPDYTVIYLEVG